MFKRTLLTLTLTCALGACATDGVGTGTGGPATVSVSLATADEKALVAAEGTYGAVLIAVNAAVDAGVLRGERAAQASRVLATAERAMVAARRAQNRVNKAQHIAEATGALASVRALLGR